MARVERIPAAGGASSKLFDFATSPDVARDGRIVFEAYDLQGGNRDGSVWLYDAAAQPAQRQLLAPKGFDDDSEPVWLPDGRRFATIRPTGSYRFDDGDKTRSSAIMLFASQDLANPRMLLLADHGSISDLAVSPDGAYLLYALNTAAGNNIWWLDVASSATGPITSDGLSSDADWRASAATRLFIHAAQR